MTEKQFIKSTTPALTAKDMANIYGYKSVLTIYRMAKRGELKKRDKGPLRFDMYENDVADYVQLVDKNGKPLKED